MNENELINPNHSNSEMQTSNGFASSELESIRMHGAFIKIQFN